MMDEETIPSDSADFIRKLESGPPVEEKDYDDYISREIKEGNGVIEGVNFRVVGLRPRDGLNFDGLRDITFENCSFFTAELQDMQFLRCTFKNCSFAAATIERCNFHDCEFVDSDMYQFKLIDSNFSPDFVKRNVRWDEAVRNWRIAERGVLMYQELLGHARRASQAEHAMQAQFEFYRWKLYEARAKFRTVWKENAGAGFLRRLSKWSARGLDVVQRLLWEWVFGNGVRLRSPAISMLVVLGVFSCVNFAFREVFGLKMNDSEIDDYISIMYYTVVATTTVGFGDITPTTGFGRVALAVQSLISYGLLGAWLGVVVGKVKPL